MQETRFYYLLLNLETATEDNVDVFIKELNKLIKKYTESGQITDSARLGKEISRLVDQFYDKFSRDLGDTAEQISKARVDSELARIAPLLKKASLFEEVFALRKEMDDYTRAVFRRLFYTERFGMTLDYRIKTIISGTQKTVRNIITSGVSQGKGAFEIADMLDKYIKPDIKGTRVSPADMYRKAFGLGKDYKPMNIPDSSVEYTALRIARTESAHIYRQTGIDFYKDRPYVKGYKWQLTNTHPRTDECDIYSKQYYEHEDEIPDQHPNCLCDIVPDIMTAEELRKYVVEYERANV